MAKRRRVEEGPAKNATRPRPQKINAYSPNLLDYPSMMSSYEKESLAAEAQLAADRRKKRLVGE